MNWEDREERLAEAELSAGLVQQLTEERDRLQSEVERLRTAWISLGKADYEVRTELREAREQRDQAVTESERWKATHRDLSEAYSNVVYERRLLQEQLELARSEACQAPSCPGGHEAVCALESELQEALTSRMQLEQRLQLDHQLMARSLRATNEVVERLNRLRQAARAAQAGTGGSVEAQQLPGLQVAATIMGIEL